MEIRSKAFKHLVWALAVGFLLVGNTVLAQTWQIADNYYGKNYDGGATDVIGTSLFNVTGMTVDINDDGDIKVTVKTNYDQDSDQALGTEYGDLFISTTGWKPSGNTTDHYKYDTYKLGSNTYNNTNWGYVFDTDAEKFYKVSGNQSFYMSHQLESNGIRDYQIVQYNKESGGGTLVGAGVNRDFDDEFDDSLLIYSGFNLSDLGLSWEQGFDLAFRWTMTCANDAIEGGGVSASAVPEPGTIMLFGIGLLGLGIAGRKTLTPEQKG